MRVTAREEYCAGCRLCEVYCAVSHSPYPADPVKAFRKSPHPPISRVLVEEQRPVSFALQCRHCTEAICVKACITGAMYRDPVTGAVRNQEERCVGCWTCILVCPFGAIRRDEQGKKVAAKCDLCAGAVEPACVKHCPNGALVVEGKGGGLKCM